MTVAGAFLHLVRNSGDLLVRRWNWKSAVLSPVFRSQIFLAVNLRAGWKAALGAMAAEFAYRSVAAGFCGALTQAFRGADPAWMAGFAVAILLPLLSHSIELLIHWLRGTPNLGPASRRRPALLPSRRYSTGMQCGKAFSWWGREAPLSRPIFDAFLVSCWNL